MISKDNQEIRFLLCVTDIYRKYMWIVALKHKNGETIIKAFKGIMGSQKKTTKNHSSKEFRKPEKTVS